VTWMYIIKIWRQTPGVDNRVSPGKGKDMLFEDMRNAMATYTYAVLIATQVVQYGCQPYCATTHTIT
jgi:hypothetical protein